MKSLYLLTALLRNMKTFVGVYVALSVLLFITPLAFSDNGKTVVYFYSSESNINNFKSLKMGYDGYLSEYGRYEFQPFSDKDVFEKQIKNKKRCILILTSWHYSKIFKEKSLEPVLVGVRNGKNCQRRILVTREKSDDLSIAFQGIATSSSQQHTSSVLKQMFKGNSVTESITVLKVPKDIDALMSVSFGMSRSALTTENSFNTMESMNPRLFKSVKILATSSESLLLILAVPGSFVKEAKKLVSVIERMPMFSDGNKKTKMLGIESWQRIEPADRLKIESLNSAVSY